MSQQRNRIDPASRQPLKGLLAAIPGGFNSISDIDQRRAVIGQLLVEPELDKNVTMENRLIPGPAGEHQPMKSPKLEFGIDLETLRPGIGT